MKSKTSKFRAFINSYYQMGAKWFTISVDYSELVTLRDLLPGSEIFMTNKVALEILSDADQEPKRARIFYALLSMGYHFIVTMRDDSKRTFYIRSKLKE